MDAIMNKISYDQLDQLQWNELCVKVKDLPEKILAKASGNVVFLAKYFLNCVTRGTVPVHFFLLVLLHEFVHVYQQAILASRMQIGMLDDFIAENRNQLEYEASVIAQSLFLTGKWKKFLDCFSSKKCRGGISLCCDRNIKSLAWAVDGYASAYIKNPSKRVNQYKKTIEKLSKDYPDDLTKMYLDIETDCKVTGIHETFTVDALEKLLDDLSSFVSVRTTFDDEIIEQYNSLISQINKCKDQIKSLEIWHDELQKGFSENDANLLLEVEKEIEKNECQINSYEKRKTKCNYYLKKYRNLLKFKPDQTVELSAKIYHVKTDIYAFRGNEKCSAVDFNAIVDSVRKGLLETTYVKRLKDDGVYVLLKQNSFFSDEPEIRRLDLLSVVLGSSVNDRFHYDNVTFGIHYIAEDDSFLNSSHHGCMQFLHSMDCSDGNRELNRKKILRWIEFCIDVFYNVEVDAIDVIGDKRKKIQELSFIDYLSLIDEQDVFWAMIGEMLRNPDKNFPIRYKPDSNKKTEENQIDFGHKIIDYLKEHATYPVNEVICDEICVTYVDEKPTMSYFTQMTIGDFFGNNAKLDAGSVALGMAVHVIQDSFAPSHSKRCFNPFQVFPCDNSFEVDVKSDEDNISVNIDVFNVEEFKVYEKKYEKKTDSAEKQKKFRDYLTSMAPPIILFADYSDQDDKKHQHADVFIKPYLVANGNVEAIQAKYNGNPNVKQGDNHTEFYKHTLNADMARDCSEAFLYMAVVGYSKKDIAAFVKSLYKLADRNKILNNTRSGFQYQKEGVKESEYLLCYNTKQTLVIRSIIYKKMIQNINEMILDVIKQFPFDFLRNKGKKIEGYLKKIDLINKSFSEILDDCIYINKEICSKDSDSLKNQIRSGGKVVLRQLYEEMIKCCNSCYGALKHYVGWNKYKDDIIKKRMGAFNQVSLFVNKLEKEL